MSTPSTLFRHTLLTKPVNSIRLCLLSICLFSFLLLSTRVLSFNIAPNNDINQQQVEQTSAPGQSKGASMDQTTGVDGPGAAKGSPAGTGKPGNAGTSIIPSAVASGPSAAADKHTDKLPMMNTQVVPGEEYRGTWDPIGWLVNWYESTFGPSKELKGQFGTTGNELPNYAGRLATVSDLKLSRIMT